MAHHLIDKERTEETVALCGTHINGFENHFSAIWDSERELWLGADRPDCEVCILLNFNNPNNTYIF